MKKVVVVGVGKVYSELKLQLDKNYDIVAILDNNVAGNVIGQFDVMPVSTICSLEYDFVFITSIQFCFEIRNQLLELEVDKDKIIPFIGCNEMISPSVLSFKNNMLWYDNSEICFGIKENEGIGGLTEIFSKNVYDFQTDKNCIVIDVGMNIGLSVLYFAERRNVMRVYGYEPYKRTYNIAQRNIQFNKELITEKIVVKNAGLGKENRIIRVSYDSDWLTRFSVIDNEDIGGKEEVEIRDAGKEISLIIDKSEKDFGCNKKIVLKMDCEGSEYDIFQRLYETDTIDNIDIIMMEYHRGNTSMLKKILFEHGFVYFDFAKSFGLGMLYAVKG